MVESRRNNRSPATSRGFSVTTILAVLKEKRKQYPNLDFWLLETKENYSFWLHIYFTLAVKGIWFWSWILTLDNYVVLALPLVVLAVMEPFRQKNYIICMQHLRQDIGKFEVSHSRHYIWKNFTTFPIKQTPGPLEPLYKEWAYSRTTYYNY